MVALAGCGGGLTATASGASASNGTFSVSPGTIRIDTNCTGCNNGSTEMLSATLVGGSAAAVTWSLPSGSNYGTINSTTGQYTPPSYLTTDALNVAVTATLNSNPSTKASTTITVTPGFLQPLSPENFAVGSGGTVQVTGYLAEAGGSTGINFSVAGTASGSGAGQGSMTGTACVRSNQTFTYCSATYNAPAAVSSTGATYVIATVGTSSSKESSVVLLNSEGVDSNPAGHQTRLSIPVYLGSSGSNNNDYDTNNGSITDCCGGTLGALVKNAGGTQFLLSNNHVFARSDQASVGEPIVQPGLIEDNCTPYPNGSLTPVGTLTSWIPLKSASTNVDAAIAQVNSGQVDPSGKILEFGSRQPDGTLAAAPPGISSSGGKGQAPSVGMAVAKSGRTTGLTCASVSSVALDVQVSYYSNCAETTPYYTKTFTNEVGITGNQFVDAGDSGSLIVNSSNAEPVGLFFAGGATVNGVSEGVANPAQEVLKELGTQTNSTYTYVGTTDHPVSCLNYGNATATAAQAITLSDAQQTQAEQAMTQARSLVNSAGGIYGVAMGKSSDRAGEASVLVYVDPNTDAAVPATIGGVRTTVIPASQQSVSMGTAPQSLADAGVSTSLSADVLDRAVTLKQSIAQNLMKQNPAFFGVGVGQSFDNPNEAALVVYVDRKSVPAQLPQTMGGMRVRYVVMDRLHVTQAYLSATPMRSHCMPQPAPDKSTSLDLINSHTLRGLKLY